MDIAKLFRIRKKDDAITIVSGLPRSGTSMMMQMLKAGGIPVVTDNIRKADKDNPLGYYEYEKVKKIEENRSWLEDCRGNAFKMVTALLYHLPGDKNYQVIFMRRNMRELLASQKAMLKRLGKKPSELGDDEMGKKYEKHLMNIREWLSMQNNIDVIEINYSEVLCHPHKNAKLVEKFLGKRLKVEKMACVVQNSLYRQREAQSF